MSGHVPVRSVGCDRLHGLAPVSPPLQRVSPVCGGVAHCALESGQIWVRLRHGRPQPCRAPAQIFTELAKVGPLYGAPEEGDEPVEAMPFYCAEPHPGLRAYPFLSQARPRARRAGRADGAPWLRCALAGASACLPVSVPGPGTGPARADVSLPWPGHGRALTGVLDRPGLKSACRVCRCGLSWRGASADSARTRAQVCRRWKGVLENPAARDVLWRELVVDFGHELITAVHMPIAWCGPRPKCFPEPPPGRPALGCCAARGVRLIHWIRPAHASPDKCTP